MEEKFRRSAWFVSGGLAALGLALWLALDRPWRRAGLVPVLDAAPADRAAALGSFSAPATPPADPSLPDSSSPRTPLEAAELQGATVVLEGVLVDAGDGRALAVGSIEAWSAPARRTGAPRGADADAEGRFRLAMAEAGPWDLRARAPGYHARDLWIDARSGEVRIPLERAAGVLHGFVSSRAGPVEGALVSLRTPGATLDTASGPDGSYTLEGVPPLTSDTVWLAASKEGYGLAAVPVGEAEAHGARRLDLFLTEERELWVTCLRADTRAPLRGARVVLSGEGLDEAPLAPPAVSGPDGVARIRGAPLGACRLAVDHPPLVPVLLTIGPGASSAPEDVLALLRPGGAVVGRVLGARGEPLAATITFWPVTLPAAPWQEVPRGRLERVHRLDEPGTLAFHGLVPEVTYRGVIEAPGHAPRALAGDIRVEAGGSVDLGTIRLEAGRSVSGRVTAPDGSPVAGVRLAVRGSLGHWIESFAWRVPPTGADGAFRLEGVPDASFWIDAFTPQALARQQVQRGESRVEIVLDTKASWRLAASFHDLRGAPVAGLRLLVGEQDPETGDAIEHDVASDADGRLEVPGLRADEATIVLVPAGRERLIAGPEVFAREAPERDLLVARARFLSGSVLALPAGEPLAGARAAWFQPAWGAPAAATTDASGAFQVAVPEEAGTLVIGVPGFAGLAIDVPTGGDDLDLGALALEPARLLVVAVRSSAGEPFPAAAVTAARLASEGLPASGLTDARGQGRLVLGEEGQYLVTARSGEREVAAQIECRGAGPWFLELSGLEAQAGIPVRVRVLDPDGFPIAGGEQVILAGHELLLHDIPDVAGVAEFANVPPAAYSVRVHVEEHGLLWAELVVPTGVSSFQADVRLSE